MTRGPSQVNLPLPVRGGKPRSSEPRFSRLPIPPVDEPASGARYQPNAGVMHLHDVAFSAARVVGILARGPDVV